MTPNPTNTSGSASVKGSLRLWGWAALVPAAAVLVDLLMRHGTVPFALRIPLAMLPLVPGALFLRELGRVFARADELATLIAREGLSFVFVALLGVFIVVDLLENGGVLSGFVWDTKALAIAMLLLALIGTSIASRRYR